MVNRDEQRSVVTTKSQLHRRHGTAAQSGMEKMVQTRHGTKAVVGQVHMTVFYTIVLRGVCTRGFLNGKRTLDSTVHFESSLPPSPPFWTRLPFSTPDQLTEIRKCGENGT
ncbi:hypothetical protein ANO14919_046020 [Xylariales sp. No.14919]|nr:hypothetical protein ANO14919_046020 [Xylariales sp. No.14919]